ncbi:MAG: LysM peptidoglycan-binding domain-containing protein [Roseburia sp.]|nr:LysM peptidoglycan-binding domain-containing protein [Roseburia sp.]MCM1243290.1 LysM peptidoglycan-binding domain-containing protein [Roseburia sp.]
MKDLRMILKAVIVFAVPFLGCLFIKTDSYAYVQIDFEPVGEIPEGADAEDYIALSAESVEYEIQKGDTLWAIAKAFLGSGERYGEIFAQNREIIADADYILPGDVIHISSQIYIPKDAYDRGGLVYDGAIHIAMPDMVERDMFLVTDIHDLTGYTMESTGIITFSLPVTNRMGENALTRDWEAFVAEVTRCSETCGGRVSNLTFEKYEMEGACDLCGYSFDFDTGEKTVKFAAFYRLGVQNMAEVIGVWDPENSWDWLKSTTLTAVTRYIAASFEDFGGEIGMGYTKTTENIGAGDWNYPELHNLFSAAMKNFITYAERPESNTAGDYVIEWEDERIEAAVRNALIELWQLSEEEKEAFAARPVMASDVAVITDISCRKSPPYFWSSNEENVPEMYLMLNGHSEQIALAGEDEFISCDFLRHFKGAQSLELKVCDLADYSFIGEMTKLRSLTIEAGKAVDNVDFLGYLYELRTLDLHEYSSYDRTDYGYENENGETAFYGITDISCLKNCPHLGYLFLEMPGVQDYSFLQYCPEICTIGLSPEICMEEDWDGYSHGEEQDLPVLPDLEMLPNARFIDFYGQSYRWEP